MGNEDGNGNGIGNGTFKWIASIMATAIVGGAIGFATATSGRLEAVPTRIELAAMMRDVDRRVDRNDEQITANSKAIAEMKGDIREILTLLKSQHP